MERRGRLSLAWRIGLAIVLVESVVLSALGLVYTQRFAAAVDARVESQVLLPGRLFNAGVLRFETIADPKTMQEVVGERLVSGLIIGTTGIVLLADDLTMVGQHVADIGLLDQEALRSAAAAPSVQQRENSIGALTPIYAAGQTTPQFFSYVQMDTSAALAEKAANLRLFVTGSVGTLLATSLILFLSLRLLILRRLNRSVAALGRFEGGDLSSRVPVSRSRDEVSALEKGINSMATRVERTVTELGASLTRTEQTMEATVEVLSNTAAIRDLYTEAHQRRVADLALRIGQRLSLSGDELKGLRISALLHDIGKIAVPVEILTKSKRLTEVEFSIIQDHPLVAHDILRDVPFPWPVARTIRQHHERLDGSGYPDGISGDAILVEARILAVADVVEAMTSDRPYRPGLGMDRALEEIKSKRCVAYDARVVDACVAICSDPDFEFAEPGWSIAA
ncbi:MAG: HD domain-containing phosphohydrolase [Candidatus Bipolaricaulia bacterium]